MQLSAPYFYNVAAWDVLQGARRNLREHLGNFWLIIRAIFYRHRKYQIKQAIHQYQNIDTHIDTSCPSLFPNAKTKKEI
jgi:hypothetical protein